MAENFAFDPQSFKGLEHAGWQRAAPVYDDLIGGVTGQIARPLLDTTRVGSGTRLLEVCCGPGYGAGAAAARGGMALGVDYAQPMVEVAGQNYPQAKFQQEDAERLSLEDGSFDAVICSFGLRHLAEPDRAIAEAYRVLVPGGHYAFTDWCGPDKNKFHGIVLGALQTHGDLNVPLPPAPPIMRFTNPEACLAALDAAGFVDATVTEVQLVWYPETADQVLELTYKIAVRMEMLLNLQAPEAREKVHQAIIEGATQLNNGERIEIPMPALLASARKP